MFGVVVFYCRLGRAGIAQLVEHLLPKQRVGGSSPLSRSIGKTLQRKAFRTTCSSP